MSTDALALLLSGRDPSTGDLLGYAPSDRTLADGRVIRAVAGFDVTLVGTEVAVGVVGPHR